MPSLDSLAETQTHRIIIYGPPKSGKTFSIGKLAESHTIHYLSLENGYTTFFNPACVLPEFRKNIIIHKIKDLPEAPVVATTIDSLFRNGEANLCEEHGRINCSSCKSAKKDFYNLDLTKLGAKDILVLDSITQWTSSINFFLNKDNPDKKFEFEDWRKVGLYLDRSLSRIQLLENTNVICISHEGESESVAGVDKVVPAAGTRNFSRNSARFFDGVYYCYQENKKHKMASSSTHSNAIQTGDRLSFDVTQYPDTRTALYALFNPSERDALKKGA